MEFEARELIGGGGAIAVAGFFAKWLWDRIWKAKDGKAASVEATLKEHAGDVAEIVRRVDAVEWREGERQRQLGAIEARVGNLDGKIEGLQTFWRGEFEKLEGKIDKRLEALESRITTSLAAHQGRVHDRLNAIAAEQSKMLEELLDTFVLRLEGAGKEKTS